GADAGQDGPGGDAADDRHHRSPGDHDDDGAAAQARHPEAGGGRPRPGRPGRSRGRDAGPDPAARTGGGPAGSAPVSVGPAGLDGIETAREIRAHRPDQAIILYTAYLDDTLQREAAAAGVSLCVGKIEGLQTLERDIRRLAGELF